MQKRVNIEALRLLYFQSLALKFGPWLVSRNLNLEVKDSLYSQNL